MKLQTTVEIEVNDELRGVCALGCRFLSHFLSPTQCLAFDQELALDEESQSCIRCPECIRQTNALENERAMARGEVAALDKLIDRETP